MKPHILNFLIIDFILNACQNKTTIDTPISGLQIDYPKHGLISVEPVSRWEESLISGNGTLSLTMPGNALKDRIVFGHEKLFMPVCQPYDAPDLGSRLSEIREAIFNGKNELGITIMEEEAKKVGIEGMAWRNPPVPACQLEFESLDKDSLLNYARSTNFETGKISVASRASDHGSVYHLGEHWPHLYCNAGTAWAAHFFYDKWLYSCDTTYLKNEAIPFMLDAYKFLSQILYKTKEGKYIFIPSYSPEVGPLGVKESAINATMDVAAMKQLLRNLISLVEQGYIKDTELNDYKDLLANLPNYAIDKNGELKEWIWDGYENNNSHTHASHLYPLYDGIDADFVDNPELQKAAVKAIESRLEYRRDKNGAEMAFGLIQLGLAAAHLEDTAHAYECIRWLCNSYWSSGQVSYHDPGEIFNLDISGGLPAVVSYMLLQSNQKNITLLPCLPKAWSNGKVKGIKARGGFIVDIEWVNYRPIRVIVESLNGNKTLLQFNEWEQVIEISKGSRMVYKL